MYRVYKVFSQIVFLLVDNDNTHIKNILRFN